MIASIADLLENVRVALDGLVVNKMRSALTMLGIVIGVGAVIALMSIGEGAQAAITGEISSIGSNLLFVKPGAHMGGPVAGAAGSAATLTYKDAEAIADPSHVPDAAVVAPEFTQSTQVIFGDTNINTQVNGTTPAYLSAYELEVARGRFIEEKDVNGRSNVAVLGYQAARDLFGGFDPVGQKIKVALPGNGGRVSLIVVGVLEEKGDSMMVSADDTVFVPIATAQTRIFSGRNPLGEPIVANITAVAASEDQTEAVEDQIEALLRSRHDIKPDEDADFMVMNQADMLEMANTVTDILTVFFLCCCFHGREQGNEIGQKKASGCAFESMR